MRIREQVSIFVLLLCLDGCWSSVLRRITSVLKQYTPEQSISRKVVYAFDKNQHQPGVDVLINAMETLLILLTGTVTHPLRCNQQIVNVDKQIVPLR